MMLHFIYLFNLLLMDVYVFVGGGLFVNIREKTVKIIHFFLLQEVPPTDCPESVVFERTC